MSSISFTRTSGRLAVVGFNSDRIIINRINDIKDNGPSPTVNYISYLF